MIPNFFSRKTIKNTFVKFLRHPESPEKTSLAVAIGVFVGFAIPIGLQIPVTLLFAVIFRVRKILAIACTLITNPYTVPFIYPVITYFGSIVLGKRLRFKYIEKSLKDLVSNFSWDALFDLSWDILLPFFVGSLVVAVISSIIAYFAAYGILMRYRKKKVGNLVRGC